MTSLPATLAHFCQRHPAKILTITEQELILAVMAQPSVDDLEALSFACQRKITLEHWAEAQFNSTALEERSDNWSEQHILSLPKTDTTAGCCETILAQAIRLRASDIHIEPECRGTRIRLRIDGVLQMLMVLTTAESHAIVSRLKLLAGVDIAENRRPQDGQLTAETEAGNCHFRLATLPTHHGEKIVLRLLQTFQADLSLTSLGMSSQDEACFIKALSAPQGLILVTGPTGSGKTATLYRALQYLNILARNLCSVEDPVEVTLDGVNQTQINLKAGLDFPLILRALLRQDPDIIMIGEIRDALSAKIAFDAAQTGHLVLSTLHTNSTCETLNRLCQMHIPGYLLASTLRLIIAQRLVRKLCSHCRYQHTDMADIVLPKGYQLSRLWSAAGCEHCFSGYYGRMALFELLPVTPELRAAIAQNADVNQLQYLAKQAGYQALLAAGLHAISQGLTTWKELKRVIGEDVCGA